MNKLLLLAVATVLHGCVGLEQPAENGAAMPATGTPLSATPVYATDTLTDTVSLIAVGDMMFGTTYPDLSEMPPDSGKLLLAPFSAILQGADITFGNAEGVFLDSGGIPKGSGANVYCFRQPVRFARYFTDHGFDLISTANNHVGDFGAPGIAGTIAALDAQHLAFAGLLERPVCSLRVRSLTIGLAAFAPHTGAVTMNDHAAAAATVRSLKKNCDIVIVSFHGGAEGKNATHVPMKREIFFGQDRGDVHLFAHDMIDAGADVVLGHGPHVPRAMELYHNKFIDYSLGNFCTYGMFSLSGISGLAPLVKIFLNSKGDFIRATITSARQSGEGGPVPDSSFGAARFIKNITQEDFPQGLLSFPDDSSVVIAP